MGEYSDKNDLIFFYKLCKFEIGEGDKCFFTDDDLSDVSTLEPLEVMRTKDVDSSSGSKLTSYEYRTSFYHEKDDCRGGTVCKFVIAIKNPQPDMESPRQATLQVDMQSYLYTPI